MRVKKVAKYISCVTVAAIAALALGLSPGSAVAASGSEEVGSRALRWPAKHSIQQPADRDKQRTVAIVIDDFGNGMSGTEEMLELPVKFTAAIMPFMPTTKRDAEEAHKRGHDVIVHMPMEPNKGLKKWLGPGAITADLSDDEIRKRVEDAIKDVPHAVGMNNHMGSKITSDERIMGIILSVCKEHGLFFLDSRTTFKTVVPKMAEQIGVPLLSNDVFLDDVYTEQHISKQIRELQKHLLTHDSGVTIGHVGPPGKKTAAVLKQSIPRLQNNVQFVKTSDMIRSLVGDPFVLPDA